MAVAGAACSLAGEGDEAIAARATTLLDEYANLPHDYGVTVGGRPAGRAILESAPAVQVAVIQAGLERVLRLSASPRHDWQRRWQLTELLKALLRRRQPFTPHDVQLLLERLVATQDRWRYGTPGLAVIRAVAAYAERHELPPGAHAPLLRLRPGALTSLVGAERRKATALFEALLGREQEEAVPDRPASESTVAPAALHGEAEALIDEYLHDALAPLAARRDIRTVLTDLLVRAVGLGSWVTDRYTPPDPACHQSGQRLLATQGSLSAAVLVTLARRLLDALERNGQANYSRPEVMALNTLTDAMAARPRTLDGPGIRHILEHLAGDVRIWAHLWDAGKILVAVLGEVGAGRYVSRARPELEALRVAGTPYTEQYGAREMLVLLDDLLTVGRPNPVEAVDA